MRKHNVSRTALVNSLLKLRQTRMALTAVVFVIAGMVAYGSIKAATYIAANEAETGTRLTTAYTMSESGASGGQAVQFGSKADDCNNFCSTPKNPVYATAPVSINFNVNTAWCGPTWDAPQEEFDLAAQKLGAGAILMPPCKKGGGYYDQTPEQYKIELDKAQKSNVKVLVFAGYNCADAYNHYCYIGLTNPDAAIDKFAYHPALAGYFISDEPNAQEFADLQKSVERIRIRRPGLLAYINLLGGFGVTTTPKAGYGTDGNGNNLTYEQYVSTFISTVKTPVLSVDDYSSPANLDSTLAVISKYINQYKTTTRPDLANGSFWSAISTVGLNATLTKEYFQQNGPAYQAKNDKYGAKTLFFTWRSPPGGGDGFTQPATGPALCGKVNNYNPGTLCGN